MHRKETSSTRLDRLTIGYVYRFDGRNLCDSRDLFMTEILRIYDTCSVHVENWHKLLINNNIMSLREFQKTVRILKLR